MQTAELTPQDDLEIDNEALAESVERGIELARQEIIENFGPNQPIETRLPFHNINHTDDVIRRAQLITDVVREVTGDTIITEREAELIPLEAAHHDTKQAFDLVPGENNGFHTMKRVRHTGRNETESAEGLAAYMRNENEKNPNGLVYTDDEIANAQGAIASTEPGWSPEFNTVTQPSRLELETRGLRLAAEVVPLADLGSAGMDGKAGAVKDHDLLFIEENVEVAHMLAREEPITDEEMAWLKNRVVDSTVGQKLFIQGRQQMLDTDLGMFPHNVAEAIKSRLFNKFEEALTSVDEAIERRRNAAPQAVIDELRSSLTS